MTLPDTQSNNIVNHFSEAITSAAPSYPKRVSYSTAIACKLGRKTRTIYLWS